MRRGKTFWSMAVSIVLVLSLFLSACSGGGGSEDTGSNSGDSEGNTEKELADKQELHFRALSDIPTLDIHQATDNTSFGVLQRVKAGLIGYENNKSVPDMAAEMPEVTNNGKTYTFTIRDDAVWSDGSSVTAQNFVYSWQRAVSKDTASPYAYIFSEANIKNADEILNSDSKMYNKVEKLGVEAVDKKTLKVTLEQATPYFTSMMSFASFYPLKKEFVEKQGDKFAQEPKNILFNGAYKLSEWNHGEGWTLVKNDDYWNADKINITKATYKVNKEVGTSVNLYEDDQIDFVSLTADYVDKYKNSEEYQEIPASGVCWSKFNVDANPIFKNKKARQAMSMVLDRKSLTGVLMNNGSIPAQYVVAANFTEGPNGKDFRASAEDYLQGDAEEAKKKWKEAKEATGVDNVELELMTTDRELSGKIAEYSAKQYEQLPGLKVSINKQPWNSYLEKTRNKNYEFAAGSCWGPDYKDPMTYLSYFESSNINAPANWKNEEYDNLVAEANQQGDQPEKRWETMQKAEKVLVNDAAVIPTFQKGGAILLKDYVEGVTFQTYGIETLWRYAKVYKH